jgi:polyribonucleotide nucleotidyltransferase
MQEIEKSISFDGRDIQLKAGLLAPQAGGSVLVQSGETSVLVTATRSSGREGIDFLPSAGGLRRTPLCCRSHPRRLFASRRTPPRASNPHQPLDRPPHAPLFPQWLRDDIQIVATTMAMDEQVPPDVLAATGASVAVLLAQIPFNGPMAAVRVGLVGDDFIINPTYKEVENGDLDLVVAGSPMASSWSKPGLTSCPRPMSSRPSTLAMKWFKI